MIKTRVWICLLVGLFLVGLALGAGPDRRNLVRRRFGAARQPSPGPELFCRKSIRNQHHHRAGGPHCRDPIRLSWGRLYADRLAGRRQAHCLLA